jgi:DNA-binding SARP family transcriptional activator
MDAILQLRLLGTPEVTIDQSSMTERLSGKAQAALYYLAVTGQPQSSPVLAGLLWGDVPEAAARANLRRALVDLRQIVGDYLEIERQSVGFTAEANVWADVVDLTTGIEAASAPVHVERLQQAVELYRGDFLAGFYVRNAPDFESWAAAERERLRELVIQALYTLVDYHIEQSELAQGIASMRRLLALGPWREEAHRQLMMLLAQDGQRSAALAQFETCRQVLEEELGVEPGEETKRLYERIRDKDLISATKFGAVEPIAGQDPVVDEAPKHNLPPQPAPLIGRAKELTEINDLLVEPNCRLLTIVGPGGIGKTRLSVEVARQALAQFADGVHFISLASTDSAEDVIPRIATVVDPETYPTGQTALDFLPQLQRRDPVLLLVLDNLEQLLPDGSAKIEELLTQTRHLNLIVTSRQALNIRWEWRYDLNGLAYPASDTADALESYSAVEMFLQRVQQTRKKT